ncbi:MAG TPA: glycosyltransferase [Acidimicrobiales bacterium]|nr:glycosyltransferase [Acidimicrobiales bacterium]
MNSVFVIGAPGSGIDLVDSAVRRLGLRGLVPEDGGGADALSAMNARLLEALDGAPGLLPDVAPDEAVRRLQAFVPDARAAFEEVAGTDPDRPWVWADPANCLLAGFWVAALDVTACVVMVHRHPDEVAAQVAPADVAARLTQWAAHNRAAMAQCAARPSTVLSYEDMAAKPDAALDELTGFLAECGMAVGDADEAAALLGSRLADAPVAPAGPEPAVDPRHRVLARVLDRLDGRHAGAEDATTPAVPALMDALSGFYDADYYGTSYDQSGVPYRRGEKLWADVFAAMAGSIVDTLAPRTVLDAGCASGMLVEALRLRGVDARGVDISEWAISQVPPELRPFCRVGSITDELEGSYDLITCFEVLEHLPPNVAEAAVANLCRHAGAVLFSSTPDDFDEPTHLNVEPGGYWARLFYRQSFLRDVDFDASFVAPHAILFRRRDIDAEQVVAEYERGWWNAASALRARTAEVKAAYDDVVAEYRSIVPLVHQVEPLRRAVAEVEQRRAAESVAAYEVIRMSEASHRRLAAFVESEVERCQAEVDAFRATKTFRYTNGARRLYGRLRGRRPAPASAPAPAAAPEAEGAGGGGSYALWIEQFDTLGPAERAGIAERLSHLSATPTISVVMPVYDPPARLLEEAIDSVRAQLYPAWQLCIADDCSPSPHVGEILAAAAAADPRIAVVRRQENGHIAAASNSALALATGEWIAPLDHDDVLAPHALALVALTLAEHPEAAVVYSDEDKLDEGGTRRDPYFKPEFDPLLLLGQNVVSHLSVFRRDLVTAVGGYRPGYEGSQDWDLTLRVTERLDPHQVVHIPRVLYHWRAHQASTAAVVEAKPYAVDAGRRAVVDHLERTGRAGRVVRIGRSGHNRVTWEVAEPAPLVSIVIPSRDGTCLPRCIDSILTLTTYPAFAITVVDNSSRTHPTLEYLRQNEARVTVIRDERPFNYAAINNDAVARTTGEVVCLLNDDTEVISPDWLTEMVGQLQQPGVGAVGAKLYYDDGRIQHAGVITGMLGVAGHGHRLFDRLSPGYFGQLQLAREMSVVTAACMVVRRPAWEAVGGFDAANLPVAFNDVDFCLRLREAGWRVVWTPNAELFHHESVSRGPDDTGPRAAEFLREVDYVQKRWGPRALRSDPAYNPNLTLDAEDFSLAWPPRLPPL